MIVTTVAAMGEAESNYDLALFKLVLTAEDILAPTANLRLKNQIDILTEDLKNIIDAHQVKVIKDSTRVQMNHAKPKLDWNNQQDGFQATYTLSFQTDSMDKVNLIHEELVALRDVTVYSPTFSLKNSDRLNKKALKNAWKKASERFSDECDIFGLDPEHYEIVSWEATYADSQRNPQGLARTTRLIGQPYGIAEDAGNPGAIVNVAKVSVNLNVSFKKKD